MTILHNTYSISVLLNLALLDMSVKKYQLISSNVLCEPATVPSLETDWWKYYNCTIPESYSALQFFLLFVGVSCWY